MRRKVLLAEGALWNTFMIAGSLRALLRLFDNSFSSTIVSISHLIERRIKLERGIFDQLYERLPSLDFSRDVLQDHEAMLHVLPVPHCGWNDLGTPQRIAMTLRHLQGDFDTPRTHHLNLADQYARCNPSEAGTAALSAYRRRGEHASE
jgi:mannose-1-phosphate guanylyltransferase